MYVCTGIWEVMKLERIMKKGRRDVKEETETATSTLGKSRRRNYLGAERNRRRGEGKGSRRTKCTGAFVHQNDILQLTTLHCMLT